MKRLEVVVEQDTLELLDQLCEMTGLKRAEWLTQQIQSSAKKLKKRPLNPTK